MTSYATAHSQQFASQPSPQHHRQVSGDSLLGYTELDTPPRDMRCPSLPLQHLPHWQCEARPVYTCFALPQEKC